MISWCEFLKRSRFVTLAKDQKQLRQHYLLQQCSGDKKSKLQKWKSSSHCISDNNMQDLLEKKQQTNPYFAKVFATPTKQSEATEKHLAVT